MMRFGNMASGVISLISALEFIGAVSVQTTVQSTTLTITSPATVLTGDLLVGITGVPIATADQAWTVPAGWTKQIEQTDAPNICIATLVATGDGSVDYSWGLGNAKYLGGAILVYRGADYDKNGAIGHATGGGAITVPSIDTTAANCAVIMACFDTETNKSFPDITGWTDRSVAMSSSYPQSWRIREKVFTAAGSTGTFSVNSSATNGESGGVLISIKPA